MAKTSSNELNSGGCPTGTVPTVTSVCGCSCTCCCPSTCCKCLRYTYKCGKNFSNCPPIPCANALLNKNNKINTESYVEKTGKYGQLIKNKIEQKHIWKISEESINEFPEFSFDPIYSKDGEFAFAAPEWDENGNLYAGVNLGAGSIPCPIDCEIVVVDICVEDDSCLECPVNGFTKVSCDGIITGRVISSPRNKRVSININNSGEVAHVKVGSYIKIDVSIGSNKKSSDDLVMQRLENFGIGTYPDDCPCSLACCECILFDAVNPILNIMKKVIYRTRNLKNDRKKSYFNREHITKNVSERLKKMRKN